jgi:hypothetical protein
MNNQLSPVQLALAAQFDEADRWLEQAATDPKLRPDQLQILYIQRYSRAYVKFRAAVDALEAAHT